MENDNFSSHNLKFSKNLFFKTAILKIEKTVIVLHNYFEMKSFLFVRKFCCADHYSAFELRTL